MQNLLSDTQINIDPQNLLNTLRDLRQEIVDEGNATVARWQPSIYQRGFLISAHNLAYYLALRKRDLRPLQAALMPWGLSSLGRIEARVLPNLDAVIATLGTICGVHITRPRMSLFSRGERLLNRQSEQVFGGEPSERRVRIMVTMPTEAAHNYNLIRDLLIHGMDCIRINCAHDTPVEWDAMITHLRRAEAETGRSCKVAMDLGGPKIRTQNVITPEGGRLKLNDTLRLTLNKPQPTDEFLFQTQCSLPQIFEQVQVGARVWIDDGKIGCVIEDITKQEMVLRVTQASAKGEKLKPEKGINFPDTELNLPALTEQDLIDLDFVAHNADIINYSFVQDAHDVVLLQKALAERLDNPRQIAIVAKVETQRAINNLPDIMIQAAGVQPFGVMIARGDLAVEIGYERLAEMQEEILAVRGRTCACYLGDTGAGKSGEKRPPIPRRNDRCCYVRTVRVCHAQQRDVYSRGRHQVLDDVLRRMADHQSKKTSQLRALRSWQGDDL